ncbi:phage head closure protein [Silvimonas soli]|uniref:phage head closure protein n=1 Tax=Silvimonas soli TaxID=2980100 RepID=UPI0024B3474D|nr:phage head closure protein [Silvimonas soli]
MRIGKLRHRINIQQRAIQRDGFGQPLLVWENVTPTPVWASVEPLRGREFIAAQQQQAELTTRIRMRYRPGITAAMRVLHGETIYNIVAPIDVEMRHVELQLMCNSGVNDG